MKANGNPWFVMIVLINFIHRDAYNLRGKQRKEELGLTYEEALTFADEDLDRIGRAIKSLLLAEGIHEHLRKEKH